MDFKAAIQAFKRRVTNTTIGVAYLGKIENGKRVIKDKARGGRYVFYTRQLDETVEIGSAILSDASLIPYEEIEDFFGVEIELGYPPAQTELHVLRITAAGYTSLGGLNPLEQVLRKVSVMSLDRIGVLRLEPTIPSSLAVKIAGEYYYQSPADGAFKRFSEVNRDLSSEVSALTTDQHRLALLSLDLTDNAIRVTLSSIKTHSGLPKRNAWLDSDILALQTGSWRVPIGVVYLYNGQPAIEEADILRRYQLRPIFTSAAKNNLNATSAPTSANNASQGYAVGSVWRNTTNNRVWICANATQTTAVWKEIVDGALVSPLTTKGDVLTHDGTSDTRLPVGSNNQFLTANSTTTTGLQWRGIQSSDLTSALSAPPSIGNVTPNAGAFTTLSTNGAFTAANAAQHTLEGLADGSFNLNVVFDSFGNFTDGARFIGRKSRGTKASPTAIQAFDGLFALDARGHDGTSYTSNARGLFAFRASQNWSPSANGTEFILALTSNNSTTLQERIFINGDGEISQLNDAAAFYFGNPFVDGTWRIRRSGNNLVFERRESSVWVVKFTISA